MADVRPVLVFSAHAADFVWRAGGAIALYVSRGCRVRILCLSYGERGESQGAWKEPGMTIDRAKESGAQSRNEPPSSLVPRFASSMLVTFRFATDALVEALVQEYRTCGPDVVLTHSYKDPYNPDHPAANQISLQTRVYAQAEGYPFLDPRSAHRPWSCWSRTSRNNVP